MATKDEIILGLYQNIDVDALVVAKRNGTLLAYYSALAERIVRPDPISRREEAVAAARNEMFQQVTNTRGQTMEDRVTRLDATPTARAIPEETRRAIAQEVNNTPRTRTSLFQEGTDRVQVRQV